MSEQSPEKLNSSEAPAETFTLASILSEYKSEAFIRNERRMNKEELEKRADEIIREMKRSVEAELSGEAAPEEEAPQPAEEGPGSPAADAGMPEGGPAPKVYEEASPVPEPEPAAERPVGPKAGKPSGPAPEKPRTELQEKPPEETPREPAKEPPKEREKEPPKEKPREPLRETRDELRAELPPEDGENPMEEPPEEIPPEPTPEEPPPEMPPPEEEAPSGQGENPPEGTEAPQGPTEAEKARYEAKLEAAERKRRRRQARAEQARRRKQLREEKALQRKAEREKEPEPLPELTPEEAAKQYASGITSLRRRMIPAFVLCGAMALLLLLSGGSLGPQALRQGKTLLILLAAIQLAVMLLGLDLLTKGVTDLLSARPGCETLILLANIASEIDAVLKISGRGSELGMPYCVTAALSLAFALWGAGCRRSAFRETIRAMRLASVPTVVSAEDKLAEEGSILNKKLGSVKGFLRRSTEPDLSERVYRKLTPACLLLVLILALAAAYLSGTGALFHCLAALSSAAAALTATLVFARPFFLTSRKLGHSGAALAGWAGAADMAKAVGLVIRDLDIYPENTVILSGMKFLSGAHVEKVVAYTGSVILATGSGLRRVFGELMRQYAAPLYRVEDFDCGTDGGVRAFIGTEQVMVGTSAYMNLMGIRVPGSVDVAGAVYTAIDHELCGVFIVSYQPLELVQDALCRLETSRLRPIFAIRDFNINPSMLIQKFRLAEDSVTFLPPENRYQLSVEPEGDVEPAALLSREGLWHYSETARGGRRLWRITRRALLMTVIGAVLGIAIVFISCARGAFGSVSPLKLLAAMLLWAFATLMIAESAEGD